MKNVKKLMVAAAVMAGLSAGVPASAVAAPAHPANYLFLFRFDSNIYDGESLDHAQVVGTGHTNEVFNADIANGSSGGLYWAHGYDESNGVVGWVPMDDLRLYG